MGKNWLTYEGVREVPVRTLKNILLEVPLMGNVDLLSIDVEGMDLDVLQSNDWSLCTPEVIVVESAHFNPNEPEKDSVFMYLRNHSYSLKAFVGTSLIFSK